MKPKRDLCTDFPLVHVELALKLLKDHQLTYPYTIGIITVHQILEDVISRLTQDEN